MKKLIILSLLIITACSKKDDGQSEPNKLRDIYQGTFWIDDTQETLMTFTPDALIHSSATDNTICFNVPEGTFSDQDFFGCTFASIVNVVEVEDEDTLSWRQLVSAASGDGCPTESQESTLAIEILNDNALEFTYFTQGVVQDNSVFTKTTSASFELNNCDTFYFLGF